MGPTVITSRFRWRRDRSTERAAATGTARSRRGLVAITALLTVCLAIAFITISIVTHGLTADRGPNPARSGAASQLGGTRHAASPGQPARSGAALTRAEAVRWIAGQLNPAATVGCDPQMCTALEAAGLPARRLLILRPSAANPPDAGIIVATSAVRSQFGARLASVYAPDLIAGFGSGLTRIEIRYLPPAGASPAVVSTTADRAAAGQQLLRNQHIDAAGAARVAITEGNVDPRLLVTLAALAAQQRVSIAAFDDASPGTAQVLLRGAEIGAGPLAGMRAMQSFLLGQQPPYLPAQARLIPAPGGQYLLSVQFYAPSPPGLASEP